MSCEHTSRCSGHCCKRFYLPMTPEELKHEATREDRFEKVRYNPEELAKVYDMVIPLKAPSEYEFGVDGVSPPPKIGYYYTCRHHDAESGNCMNYADRPAMCSSYPFYGNPRRRCEYQECTWDDGRNPAVPVERWSLIRKLPRSLEGQLCAAKDTLTKEPEVKYKAEVDTDCKGPAEVVL